MISAIALQNPILSSQIQTNRRKNEITFGNGLVPFDPLTRLQTQTEFACHDLFRRTGLKILAAFLAVGAIVVGTGSVITAIAGENKLAIYQGVGALASGIASIGFFVLSKKTPKQTVL